MNQFGVRLLPFVRGLPRGITRSALRFRPTFRWNSYTMAPAIFESPILPARVPTRNFQTSVASLNFVKFGLREENCIFWDEFMDGVQNDKLLVVDVRRKDEVDKGRVPAKRYIHVHVEELEDALEMTNEEFKQKYGADKRDKNADDTVFFCRLGIRSSRAVKLAKEAGYKSPRHYPGGWSVWNERIQDA